MGDIYDSLSHAGKACRRLIKPEINQPNGWDFWATLEPDGTYKKMLEWRKEYKK